VWFLSNQLLAVSGWHALLNNRDNQLILAKINLKQNFTHPLKLKSSKFYYQLACLNLIVFFCLFKEKIDTEISNLPPLINNHVVFQLSKHLTKDFLSLTYLHFFFYGSKRYSYLNHDDWSKLHFLAELDYKIFGLPSTFPSKRNSTPCPFSSIFDMLEWP